MSEYFIFLRIQDGVHFLLYSLLVQRYLSTLSFYLKINDSVHLAVQPAISEMSDYTIFLFKGTGWCRHSV